MWAFKNVGQNVNANFYKCPITISPISNVKIATQNVPDSVARLAASAFALQGGWAVNDNSEEQIWTQFQFYPFG